RSTLFPYTTLFRSNEHHESRRHDVGRLRRARAQLRQALELRHGRLAAGGEQDHRQDRDLEQTHGHATCWLPGSPSSACSVRASLKYWMLLSGRSSRCRFAHSIVMKLSVAATICIGGTRNASSSFWPSLPAHSNSVRSWLLKPMQM